MNISVPSRLPKWNGIMYVSGMRGLGDDDSGDYTDLLPPVTDPYASTPLDVAVPVTSSNIAWTAPNTSGNVSTTPAAGVNNSQLTASTINTLVTAGTQIGKTLAAEAAPSGSQLVYNAQGQLVSATSIPTSLLSSLTSSSSSSMIIWLAVAAVAVMALEGGRK